MIAGLRATFDANVFVRGLVDGEPAAASWVARAAADEVDVNVPDLVFAEVGNAFAGYVRASRLTPEDALDGLELVLRLPSRITAVAELAPAALRLALSHGLSVYDGCYAALAEADGAVLVTADRRLAAAVTQAELV